MRRPLRIRPTRNGAEGCDLIRSLVSRGRGSGESDGGTAVRLIQHRTWWPRHSGMTPDTPAGPLPDRGAAPPHDFRARFPVVYSTGISNLAMMPGSPPWARSSGSGSRVGRPRVSLLGIGDDVREAPGAHREDLRGLSGGVAERVQPGPPLRAEDDVSRSQRFLTVLPAERAAWPRRTKNISSAPKCMCMRPSGVPGRADTALHPAGRCPGARTPGAAFLVGRDLHPRGRRTGSVVSSLILRT